jgi:hypothetical protein
MDKFDFSQADDKALKDMHQWFSRGLDCVAGRAEYKRSRYYVDTAYTPADTSQVVDNFRTKATLQEATACLIIFPGLLAPSTSVVLKVTKMAELLHIQANKTVEQLINGDNLNFSLQLLCPVTNRRVSFDDFDGVAFCPESNNKTDPLYDPLMFAPYPCVNISSDIYSFSCFVSDFCVTRHQCAIYELPCNQQKFSVMQSAAEKWQKMAERTIDNFLSRTDTSLCPTFLTEDKCHWYANHQDPAFAETKKELYRHDMPKVYAPKVVSSWMHFFEEGKILRNNFTPPGIYQKI